MQRAQQMNRAERIRRRKAQIRHNRIVVTSWASALAGVGLVISTALGGSASPSLPTSRSIVTPPALVARSTLTSRIVVPGRHLVVSWPKKGQGAIAVLGENVMAESAHERSVPIASLTKMMTAYVVLRDHPLALGQGGPSLAINRSDVAEYVYDDQNDLSNVPVSAGEVLDERQLLEGLLIPSGDNIADVLAKWDAGSVSAFVKKMNAESAGLGLIDTHYVDANGVHAGSRSTAADQAELGAILMKNPVVRQIVRMPSLRFPVAGVITNYNPALGVDGIIGVKSGFTGPAAGCLVTAAFRRVGRRSALVVVASLGQPDGLYGAARVDIRLLAAASSALVPFKVVSPDEVVGDVKPQWSNKNVAIAASDHGGSVVGWPGLVLRRSIVLRPLPVESLSARKVVGSLVISASGDVATIVAVHLQSGLPPVPAGYVPGG